MSHNVTDVASWTELTESLLRHGDNSGDGNNGNKDKNKDIESEESPQSQQGVNQGSTNLIGPIRTLNQTQLDKGESVKSRHDETLNDDMELNKDVIKATKTNQLDTASNFNNCEFSSHLKDTDTISLSDTTMKSGLNCKNNPQLESKSTESIDSEHAIQSNTADSRIAKVSTHNEDTRPKTSNATTTTSTKKLGQKRRKPVLTKQDSFAHISMRKCVTFITWLCGEQLDAPWLYYGVFTVFGACLAAALHLNPGLMVLLIAMCSLASFYFLVSEI